MTRQIANFSEFSKGGAGASIRAQRVAAVEERAVTACHQDFERYVANGRRGVQPCYRLAVDQVRVFFADGSTRIYRHEMTGISRLTMPTEPPPDGGDSESVETLTLADRETSWWIHAGLASGPPPRAKEKRPVTRALTSALAGDVVDSDSPHSTRNRRALSRGDR